MSLVDTFHRAHLERQLRIARAGARQAQRRAAVAECVADVIADAPVRPQRHVSAPDGWVERQIERFKEPWFQIVEGPSMAGDRKSPEIKTIIRTVARHYRVSIFDLLSHRRTANIVRPRQIAMYLCKEMTLRSLPEIGRRFSGRDHTTVLHAVRKVAVLVQRNADFARDVEEVCRKCEVPE